ncbi:MULTISPECIES: hypothetical protein [Gammaproteobacteria]|uniref:hypothetical protein n=1 Tax=Gammaproteobacteria TaxID=1236 RepID=UPI001ADA4488|nr:MULTISPECIES: hypothetical protein [Gammaproteobacteria]MBO9484387.1 hypothetical protein [Salinisphaera sp. G21_0]MBO9497049.1 hypothetical protein [Thalassotalea sp. G20_0]
MPDIQWSAPGATLSHKNGAKEFGLTEDEVIRAIKEGTLHYQIAHAHGNPYFRVVREEVEALVLTLYGPDYVNQQQLKKRQDDIDREIRKLKRRIKALEKERLPLSGSDQ